MRLGRLVGGMIIRMRGLWDLMGRLLERKGLGRLLEREGAGHLRVRGCMVRRNRSWLWRMWEAGSAYSARVMGPKGRYSLAGTY